MREKPALFQALRNRREREFPCDAKRPTWAGPTPSSNKPPGREADSPMRGAAAGKHSLGERRVPLFTFGCAALFGVLRVRPALLNVRLQQCAQSMTSLFVKIDYFK